MRPWLALRSDTFRVRSYGDSVNRSDPARVESVAWCEAIVQRVKGEPTGKVLVELMQSSPLGDIEFDREGTRSPVRDVEL